MTITLPLPLLRYLPVCSTQHIYHGNRTISYCPPSLHAVRRIHFDHYSTAEVTVALTVALTVACTPATACAFHDVGRRTPRITQHLIGRRTPRITQHLIGSRTREDPTNTARLDPHGHGTIIVHAAAYDVAGRLNHGTWWRRQHHPRHHPYVTTREAIRQERFDAAANSQRGRLACLLSVSVSITIA